MSMRTPFSTYLGTRYITDGSLRGLVVNTGNIHVCIFDRTTGQQHNLHVSVARRMTNEEMTAYNEQPGYRDPASDQIAKRAAEIRAFWNPTTRRSREQPRHLPIGELPDV